MEMEQIREDTIVRIRSLILADIAADGLGDGEKWDTIMGALSRAADSNAADALQMVLPLSKEESGKSGQFKTLLLNKEKSLCDIVNSVTVAVIGVPLFSAAREVNKGVV